MVPLSERTSTHEVLPPYFVVVGPGFAIEPRVPQNWIRMRNYRFISKGCEEDCHKQSGFLLYMPYDYDDGGRLRGIAMPGERAQFKKKSVMNALRHSFSGNKDVSRPTPGILERRINEFQSPIP